MNRDHNIESKLCRIIYALSKLLVLAVLLFSVQLDLDAQTKKTIRGSIIDKSTGEPIIGATVVEYDKNNRILTGSISDVNGNFQISISDPNATLVASSIGYEAVEVDLNGRSSLEIIMESGAIDIEEVVVTAESNANPLTNIPARDVTSSVVKVDMSEAKFMGGVSADEALQGQVSGLDIISSSGDPGSGSQIVIRGLGSLGNAKPLIVVDGISMDIRINDDFNFGGADQEDIGALVNIAPQDIKSITVLKDAASSAIWGSKGADGVLMIETFRGRRGKTSLEYQGKYSLNIQPPPIPMLNGDEYIMLQLEEYHNAYGAYSVPPEIAYDLDFQDFYNYNANTDWIGAITQPGFINDQYLKISGGGERTRYFTSLNYQTNTGTTLNTPFNRLSTRINLDYNISDKLKLSVNFSYTNSIKEGNYNLRGTNVRSMAYVKAPNMSIYEYDQFGNPTGDFFNPINSYQGDGISYFNPVAIAHLSSNDVAQNEVLNSYLLDYNILPWLRFRETVSFQYLNEKANAFLPYNAVGADWLNANKNQASETNSVDTKITTRSQLFFVPRLGNEHSFSAILMHETDQRTQDWSRFVGSRSSSFDIYDPAANAVIQSLRSGSSDFRALGALVSVNYKYRDRYITAFNLRADGSSKFGANRRWGIFPSASIGWRFSEETFLDSFKKLSDGKLRLSYGQTGREPGNPYDRHAIYNTTDPSQYIYNPVIIPQQVQLDNLKWQTLSSWNLGLDLSFFKDALSFTAEVYNKVTKDLLWKKYEIPSSSGFDNLSWFNGGELENKGWELFIMGRPIKRDQFSVNLSFNISQNINTFLDFPDNFNNEVATTVANGQYPRRASIGEPIGSFYGFRYLGVWPSTESVVATNADGSEILDANGNKVPLSFDGKYNFQGGDAKYEDLNHDGVIDLNDVVYLGSSNPDFFGGFGGGVSWKNIRMNFQFLYRTGYQIVNEVAMESEGMLDKNNQSKAVLHRWRVEGQDDADMLPRAYLDHEANNLGSDRYVEDGDFIRLNNLSLRYVIDPKLIKKLGLNSLDISLSMRKVLTFTKYSGQDPEIPQDSSDPFWFGTDQARTPTPKFYTLSFAIGF